MVEKDGVCCSPLTGCCLVSELIFLVVILLSYIVCSDQQGLIDPCSEPPQLLTSAREERVEQMSLAKTFRYTSKDGRRAEPWSSGTDVARGTKRHKRKV